MAKLIVIRSNLEWRAIVGTFAAVFAHPAYVQRAFTGFPRASQFGWGNVRRVPCSKSDWRASKSAADPTRGSAWVFAQFIDDRKKCFEINKIDKSSLLAVAQRGVGIFSTGRCFRSHGQPRSDRWFRSFGLSLQLTKSNNSAASMAASFVARTGRAATCDASYRELWPARKLVPLAACD